MLILLGVAGSGKSTQGQLLAERRNLRWISMGNILRRRADKAQQERMQHGELLDNQETIKILKDELKDDGDDPEIILDGFPRAFEQAVWLVEEHKKHNLKLSAVINLIVAESIVEKRLLDRGRADDNKESIKNRFDIYQKNFKPIIDYLSDNHVPVLEINADQTPELILEDTIDALVNLGIKD
jgi:adenylate kinase